MKDIVDAVGERVKSPYFGYSVIAFFAINWKELFVLFLSDKTADERILYFDWELFC